MTTVTTWTGRDANALRHALRMSMTGFAEHLGAARRTVATWSSQGDKVLPRADMQAALDTVLSRATPEARARFEALRTVGTSDTAAGAARPGAGGHADTGDGGDHDSDSGGDVRRRALLRGVAIGVAATATRLGYDGNDRWTGFGAVNVLLHQVNIALALGDAGTAIAVAHTVALDKVTLVERRASLYVDVARAYTQWGRYEHGLNALRTAYEVAPEEIRCRPNVHRIASDLAILATGSTRTAAVDFAQSAGIAL